MTFNNDDEISIDIYETISGKYVDSTSAVAFVEDDIAPTLKIDVEAGEVQEVPSVKNIELASL